MSLSSLKTGWQSLTSPEKVGRLKEDVQELRSQVVQDQTDMKQDLVVLGDSVSTLVVK